MRAKALAVLTCVAFAGTASSAGATPATLHLTAYVYGKKNSAKTFSSHERLYQGSKKVGEDFSSCKTASKTTVRCTGTYMLQHGSFTISGTISNDSNSNRLQLLDGTGSYKGVHASVLTDYNKAGTRAAETVTFRG